MFKYTAFLPLFQKLLVDVDVDVFIVYLKFTEIEVMCSKIVQALDFCCVGAHGYNVVFNHWSNVERFETLFIHPYTSL